jgi:hypothetical protein
MDVTLAALELLQSCVSLYPLLLRSAPHVITGLVNGLCNYIDKQVGALVPAVLAPKLTPPLHPPRACSQPDP